MPTECNFTSHDFNIRSAGAPGPSAAVDEIKCRWCGVRMTVSLHYSGKTVRQDVHIYPATGDSRISKEILVYFFSVLGSKTEEMKRDGYRVLDTTSTVHAITPPGPWLTSEVPNINGLAKAARVFSFLGFLGFAFGPIGLILGYIALGRLRADDVESRKVARTAIIVGWIFTVLFLLLVIGIVTQH